MSTSFVSLVEAQVASGKTKLPVFAGTAQRLQQMIESPPDTVQPVVNLIGSDPVLASAVLRLANSSFFGGLVQVKTIQQALSRLGMDQVMRLALVVSQQQAYRVSSKELQPIVSALWHHSLATALGCQWLAQRLGRSVPVTEAFLAGLVHDIGELLIVRVIDDLRKSNAEFRPPQKLVLEMLDTLHARHGAALARGWNLPENYVHVIEHHHDEEFPENDRLLAMVRLVDLAANGLGFGLTAKREAHLAATREAQALGLSDIVIAELELFLEDSVKQSNAA
jgi:putative nucleotidyltransferase with HDIG domain